MRLLASDDSRTLWLARATRPYAFASPTGGADFALLLVVADEDVTPDEQDTLSVEVVRAGCRHAVCFGPTSSAWDDSIDMVTVLDEVDGRAGPFVMTSWFDRSPLEEAVAFFAHASGFDDWIPHRFVALVLGGEPDLARDVERALLSHFR